jgi:hypothetical protein
MNSLDVKQGVGGVDRIDVDPVRGHARVAVAIKGWDPCTFSLTCDQARELARLFLEAAADADIAPREGP